MGSELFVGRREEVARGGRALERALGGEGGLLLLSGEGGLGKTRLAQAIAQDAGVRGARVVWGRAWEAGGAPSYWPWIQVFRALGAAEDPFRSEERGPFELPQARFAKFDRAARWLKESSRESALAIVLDDLHAADVPSLLFLQFLARDLAGARILLLATYREIEARLDAEVGGIIAKLERVGETSSLDRLSRQDVLEWLCAATGDGTEAARAEAERLHATTEGNALFVHELLRVRGRSPADASRSASLRAVLDEHLGRLEPSTRALLEMGSVLGRDLDPAMVAALSGRSRDDVERALREARDAGVVGSLTGSDRLSFTHILLRERLYEGLLPSMRATLHNAAAEAILAVGGDVATATHHLFSSASPASHVAEIALAAARVALGRLAFEDAAALCERALDSYQVDDALTVDIEVTLGEASMRSGKGSAGRAVCLRAVDRAKRAGLGERLAEAALVYGTELMTGGVDPTMVAILRDAKAALPETDSPLRARVLGRLAAALVPPRTSDDLPEIHGLGAESIAMARRLGDPDTLLYTLHLGGASAGYVVTARERLAHTRELVELATTLGRPLVILAVGGWWVSVLREEGLLDEASAALASYERVVAEFPQPHYQWRTRLLRATFAALDADFEAAERLAAETRELVDQGPIPIGQTSWALFQIAFAHLRGEPRTVLAHLPSIEAYGGRLIALTGFSAWTAAAAGDHARARQILVDHKPAIEHFPWWLISCDAIVLLGDRALAEDYYPGLCMHSERNPLFWGPFGTGAIGPTHAIAGDLAQLLGKTDEARRWYEATLAIGQRMAAPVFTARAERGLAALAGAKSAPPPSKRTSAIDRITIERDGEMWRVGSSTGVTMHLKDGKGLAYLSHLVAHPGQELHVTQLAEVGDVSADAGAVLDTKAKADYRARLEDLKDRLEEAERFGDATKANTIRGEIDAVAEELAGAVGLGGRDRKIGSQVEKVRINVQRRLKDALQRIEENDPALGRYLTATVKTGTFCIFSPI